MWEATGWEVVIVGVLILLWYFLLIKEKKVRKEIKEGVWGKIKQLLLYNGSYAKSKK